MYCYAHGSVKLSVDNNLHASYRMRPMRSETPTSSAPARDDEPVLDWRAGVWPLIASLVEGVGLLGSFAQEDMEMTNLEKACVAVVAALAGKLEEMDERRVYLVGKLADAEKRLSEEMARADLAQARVEEATRRLSDAETRLSEVEVKLVELKELQELADSKRAKPARRADR